MRKPPPSKAYGGSTDVTRDGECRIYRCSAMEHFRAERVVDRFESIAWIASFFLLVD
jgi:hypothetical protein